MALYFFDRLTQDALENLFSQIRSRGQPNPSPLFFRRHLRLITICQLTGCVGANASYDEDDDAHLLEFLKMKGNEKNKEEDVTLTAIDVIVPQVINWSQSEDATLRYITGWLIFKDAADFCVECLDLLKLKGEWVEATIADNLLTFYKEYKSLTRATDRAFQFLKYVEFLLQGNLRVNLFSPNVVESVTKATLQHCKDEGTFSCFFDCCNTGSKLITRYTKLRVLVEARKFTLEESVKIKSGHGSKSAKRATIK